MTKPYRRTRNPKLVRLKKRAVDETRFVETLVYLLDLARQGKILGSAMVYIVEDLENNRMRSVEGCDIQDERDSHSMLGYIERMKMNFIARAWGNEGGPADAA